MNFPVLKRMLVPLGRFVSTEQIRLANGVLNYLSLGRWFRDRGLKVPVRCATREELYSAITKAATEPVSYLEFGVHKGYSIGCWSKLLKHPESFLHGFDSFEGLPEDWGPVDKQYLNVGGKVPKFDDARIRFFKGWFSETLPGYLKTFKPHPNLVVYLDADLYSSTIFVLHEMRAFLKPGTLLVFDEFWDREHEMRAFSEFLTHEKVQIECVAATSTLSQVAFRITGRGCESQPRQHTGR